MIAVKPDCFRFLMRRALPLVAVLAGLCIPLALPAYADDMSSSSYRLQFGNFNITSGRKTSASYKVTDTVGQTAPGQYGLANNVVKSGFQYIYPLQRFTFKVAPTSIAFGSLTVGTFATATQTLEITTVGAGGYNVTVSEDHLMQLGNNLLIDSDMERTDTSAWTALNGATLSKQTTNPHGGSRLLRVARNATNVFYAYQNVTTVGKTYRITGFARSDGTTTPNVSKGTGLIWTGTTSTAWQPFNVTFTATGTQIYLGDQSDSSGYVEFDDVSLTQDASIPDTLCDTTCSETTAAAWSNTSKYGFGYTMTGDDVVTGFGGGTNFKQFANLAIGKTPQAIMSSTAVGTKRHGVLTYKINVGSSQQAGDYSTTITYIAIPGY